MNTLVFCVSSIFGHALSINVFLTKNDIEFGKYR